MRTAGSLWCTPVLAALLLCFSMVTADLGHVIVNKSPTTTACDVTQRQDSDTGGTALSYKCDITPENRKRVLKDIREDGIKYLSIVIRDMYQAFAFGNESFSKDLESLTISVYCPILISSGTFRGSERISQLELTQKYAKDESMSKRKNHWTSLQFEPGWLKPLAGLTYLDLSYNSIERFPDMQFCHLKRLQHLDLSNNNIKSSEGLGISGNSSKGPFTPCLPNVESLIITNNPIGNFTVNIRNNLPLVKTLTMINCSLTHINVDAVLSTYMETLDISKNKLSFLGMGDPRSCKYPHLTSLFLYFNSLHTIAAGLFGCIHNLTHLGLRENQLSEDSLITAGLNNLTELLWLDLSYNKFTTLSAELIGSLVKLQQFDCSGCGLRRIEKGTFYNLENLNFLSLDGNRLHYIEDSTFTHLHAMGTLDLSNNFLVTIPDFSNPMPSLQILRLNRNTITEITPNIFHGLSVLRSLSLAFNHILYVHDNAFSGMPALAELYINDNKLKTLQYSMQYAFGLRILQLNNNLLEEIPSLTFGLRFLQSMYISQNRIRKVHIGKSDSLRRIDLSFNNIAKFASVLSHLPNLQWMNLAFNNLRELNEDDFLTNTQPRPTVLLQGNPLHCDCQLGWLLNTKFNRPYDGKQRTKFKDIKYRKHPSFVGKWYYPKVPDLDSLQCRTSGSDDNSIAFTRADFVCPYQEECDDWGCYEDCCSQDPNCPCRGFCYPDCSCYYKYNHKIDYMNCTSRNITSLSHKGPIYAKQIYLDGNNLTSLSSKYMDFPRLTALFANKSNITYIQSNTFEKLDMLEILHLEQNYIERIKLHTFRNVLNLKELYLQNNKIHSIENESFMYLPYLKTIKLHGNKLQYLNFTLVFEGLKLLTEVTLHNNPWVCDCETGPMFHKWLIEHHQIVTDIDHIYCMNDTIYNELNGPTTTGTESGLIYKNQMNTAVIKIDFSLACNNVEKEYIKPIIEVTSLTAAFGVFIIITIVVYNNLLLLKIWVYNRFGIRLHREDNDNAEKPYDVFLTYPRQEDRFVVQHLLPELETGNMSYRICLEGRDWPPGADKSETMIASVQQSKRTILLVSEHHFNSQWCEFSFEAAHYQVLMDKQIRLIIILTDARLKAQMNRTMKMYTRTNAFMVVGEKWFWKKLRYYLADNPRGADYEVGREFTLMEVYKNQGQ